MKSNLLSNNGRAFDLALERFTIGLGPVDHAELEALACDKDRKEFELLLAAIHIGSLTRIEQPPARALGCLKRAGHEYLKARDEESDSGHDHMV